MTTAIKVVLFEDTDQIRLEILNALKQCLLPDGVALLFGSDQFTENSADQGKMYEDRLEKILSNQLFSDTTLIVADGDLSKSTDSHFGGLSVNAVAAAAKRLAIPVCSYSRQPELADYELRGRGAEGQIVLRFSDSQELARTASLAARGFAAITVGLPEAIADKSKNNSVAKILAVLLGKPDFSEKIALYSVGDQSRLSEIIANPNLNSLQVRTMSHFLGYWLWDSLLRYPGLFVNKIAAASYLNIDTSDFGQLAVRSLFDEALYKGPFADSVNPQWWRGMLDDIVSRENCADGLQLAQNKLSKVLHGCKCCVDPTMQAGYYCIISRAPVSFENSKGGLSWFPRGADLTRISNPKYEEYGPWLGV
jgi:hypothetical protein